MNMKDVKTRLTALILFGVMMLTLSACGQSGVNTEAQAALEARAADAESRIAVLEAEVQTLHDINEIKLLQERFCNLADVKDAAAQMDLFTEDAQLILNFGGQTMNLEGTEQIFAAFDNTLSNTDILYHMGGQGTIEVIGDTASGVAYCRVVLIDTEDGVTSHTDERVRYTDEYVRQDGKWLISKRTSDFLFVDQEQTQAEE